MEREQLKEIYEKYCLEPKDIFNHKHYIIVTRSGIEKIQAKENIEVQYEVVRSEPNFAAVKATSRMKDNDGKFDDDYIEIQTFGSALKGKTYEEGNTNSWYVLEMAEKRAFSRAVLKVTGLYEMGIFGQDESEDFKQK